MLKPLSFLLLAVSALVMNTAQSKPSAPEPSSVAESMQSVADWQIEHFRGTYSGREKPHHIRDWTNGALYVGMLKWAKMSGDPRYQEWLRSISERSNWDMHWRTYMADDHIIGQLHLDLYRLYHDADMIAKTKKRLDLIMASPSTQPIEMGNYDHLERWTWCDALFMGPPVWAKMTAITGDRRYLDWMMDEFKATTDHLFDKKESLYFRDNTFIDKRHNNKKIFWARGNGWVFGGLTLLMDELDPKSKEYAYFKKIYLKMAAALLKLQTPEGHWAMSLVDAKNYPTPETSGTSFFTFGLAWGVNNGLLKKSKYEPAIYKAWASLQSHITDQGMLGYVQPIGAAPGDAWPDKSEVYGTGAFLAAGSELYKLVGGRFPANIKRSAVLDAAIATSDAALDKEYAKKKIPGKLFARVVPERKDDFAWENDLVAFRAYGPALRGSSVNAGIDCWLKRVKYPIIDKWYSLAVNDDLSYHVDRGEGYDPYHVGASAGCGGSALWIDGQRQTLETYVAWSDLSYDEKHLSFTLKYEHTIAGDEYIELKRISLVPGVRLFKVESTFKKNGKVAAGLPIAVGLATHGGNADLSFNPTDRWMMTWEKIDGSNLGTAVVIGDGQAFRSQTLLSKSDPDQSHGLLIANTNNDGKLVYYAGYGWEKAGEITSKYAWGKYLSAFSKNNPY